MSRRAAADETATRFDVHARDGTSLAVWGDGTGPPLVMVHGSIADHSTFASFVGALRRDLATFAMDRRGFGSSGDAPCYSIERDFEDVAAVVDAVTARVGSRVAVFGHSYGANCAMGAATLTDNIDHLVLYEPSLGMKYAPGAIEAIERALATGDREAAIVAVLVGVLEMTAEEVDEMRSSPRWPDRLAAAPTVPRECRAEDDWVYRPGQFERVTCPTLLLAGSESVPTINEATRRAAAALPRAQVLVLEGHAHLAHKTDPAMVAAIVQQFISS